MKVTWLGQAGLLFEYNEIKILIDPYLSDSCRKVNPKSVRRIPVDERFLNITPDVLVLTHKHLDHTDPETLKHYLGKDGDITVLASKGAWEIARGFGGNHNYVMFNHQTEFTICGICFKAIYAEHSDENAIGVVFECDGLVYYIAGDTLYNECIFSELQDKIDVLFLPVNGKGNNLNFEDAKRFAKRCGAKKTVPVHWGMFDEYKADDFVFENFISLEPYKTEILKNVDE